MLKKTSNLQGFIKTYEVPIVAQSVTDIKTIESPPLIQIPYEYPPVTNPKRTIRNAYIYRFNDANFGSSTLNDLVTATITFTEDVILKNIFVSWHISATTLSDFNYLQLISANGPMKLYRSFFLISVVDRIVLSENCEVVYRKGETISFSLSRKYTTGNHFCEFNITVQPY